MATSEKARSRSGSGWLPRLILGAVVIGFGYLYLASSEREGGGASTAALLESIAKLSPIPIKALPLSEDTVTAADRPVAPVKADEPAARPATAMTPQPVDETESSVFARSLIQTSPVPAADSRQGAPEAAPAAVSPPPAVAQTPVLPQPSPAPAMPYAPGAPGSQGGAIAQPEYASDAGRADGWDPMARERAQILAQYEAMRREADQRMRQGWDQMRSYAPPVAGPYGYPAYGPGYLPGPYAPIR